MCEPEVIAAILDQLGSFDKKKEKDKKEEVFETDNRKDTPKNSGEEEQKEK